MTEVVGFIWNQILLNPSTNLMVLLDRLLFGSYGLALIVFTVALRLITLPLTLKQMRSSKRMTQLQPKIQEIQKTHKDPKRRSEETMKLYKEEGVNPAGCLVPTLVQFPVLIALYEVIRITLGTTPESLIDLSHRLYPWQFVQQGIPLASHFLWMDLGSPDNTYLMPILVVVTMWLSQRLTMTKQMQANPQAAQTNQIMLIFMPLLFGWLSIKYPSGLGLYWVLSNAITVVVNYFVFDWHGTHPLEILGLRDFSLASLNPFALADPKAKKGKPRRGPDAGGASSRNGRSDKPDSGADSEALSLPAGRNGGETGGSRDRVERGARPATARKSRPKAQPPVRAAAPGTTARLKSDPAAQSDTDAPDAEETRSTDG
jgi:YidC/Oxa1 family membrane protein insertase